jgi:AraC-like DNA-binding protein
MDNIPIRHIPSSIEKQELSGTFHIQDIEPLLAGKDMIQELHRHSFFYLLVLEKGSGEHSIDFVSYKVRNHSIFFMRPGQVHALMIKKGSKGFLVQFNNDFSSSFEREAGLVLRKISNKNFCPLDARRCNRLLTILSDILEEFRSKKELYQEVIRSGMGIFFIELLRQSKEPGNLSGGSTGYQQQRLEELHQLMARHISEHKEVGFYAGQLHLTPYQLNAITKATLGKTCSAVINDHITLEIRRQLLATSNQINQIAGNLGYEDVSYFSRFFRKQTGHSPEAFRRNFK